MNWKLAVVVTAPVVAASVMSLPVLGEVSYREMVTFWVSVWMVSQVVVGLAYIDEEGV